MTHHHTIRDVDTGTDDAVAIMLALRHPRIELVGITTANGDATFDVVVDITLRVLELAGTRVAVLSGAERPLQRGAHAGRDPRDRQRHARLGLQRLGRFGGGPFGVACRRGVRPQALT